MQGLVKIEFIFEDSAFKTISYRKTYIEILKEIGWLDRILNMSDF